MRDKIINAILEYFENNEDTFNQAIEELDRYNGWLGDDRYYSMAEFNELHYNSDPLELLERAYYGHDADTWYTDRLGNKEYGPFNPNRDYFAYNGYGNLISTDYIDYSAHLDRYVIDEMLEHREYIYTITDNDELTGLFDQVEALEEVSDND